ncbi:ABC transporter permease [Synechococcus sp. UW140]|uniref:ABC transporter permease n=1 Tax=Synechococcus sp. UW140 TaxID=368503 RepID=UPI003137A382
MKPGSKSILKFPQSLWKHRQLWWRLTEREVLGRYRGSMLGIGWSLITPLAMLAVYTFVFSQVFQARWGGLEQRGPLEFATNLFAGLIVFNFFSECASRAPSLVISNPNYVKKVVFPLETLGSVAVGSAIFHAITSLVILMIFQLIAFGSIPITLLWLPLVWLPLLVGSLGVTWLLCAAGVFLRDINQFIGVILNMLMFLSPVFYPLSAMPQKFKPFLQLNPLAEIMEQTRRVCLQGTQPELNNLAISIVISFAICELSHRVFLKSERGFADVL